MKKCMTVIVESNHNEEDSDSGHNSDELNVTSPFIDNRDTSCAIEENDNIRL
jgi:hypothetical protein